MSSMTLWALIRGSAITVQGSLTSFRGQAKATEGSDGSIMEFNPTWTLEIILEVDAPSFSPFVRASPLEGKASSPVQPSVEGLPLGGWGILSGSTFCGRPPLWGWRLFVISLLFLYHAFCLPITGFWLELRSWPWHEPIEAKSTRGFARSLDTSLWKPTEDTAVTTPFSPLQLSLLKVRT